MKNKLYKHIITCYSRETCANKHNTYRFSFFNGTKTLDLLEIGVQGSVASVRDLESCKIVLVESSICVYI